MLLHFCHPIKVYPLLFLLLFCGTETAVHAQTVKRFNGSLYKLEKRLRQHGSAFLFWRGQTDSTTNKLIVERIYKGSIEILYDGYVRDGEYAVRDVDSDGYNDFVTYYHDFEEVSIYDTATKTFAAKAFYIPRRHGTIDAKRKALWAYRDAQYGEPYPYSLLYSFRNNKPYFFYKLIYFTKEDHSSKENAILIKLYRFNKNNYNDTSFIQNIKTPMPSSFDAERYWKQNYKKLFCRK